MNQLRKNFIDLKVLKDYSYHSVYTLMELVMHYLKNISLSKFTTRFHQDILIIVNYELSPFSIRTLDLIYLPKMNEK